MLVAALFDGQADNRRIELLYRDAPDHFGLFSKSGNGSEHWESICWCKAKKWISTHADRITVIAEVRGLRDASGADAQHQDGSSTL